MTSIHVNDEEVTGLPINGRHFQNLATLSEPDLVLRSHLMTEQLLEYFINKILGYELVFDKARLSFEQKRRIAKNLGLRQELASFIKRFNALRNKFAHNIDYEVSDEDISELKSLANSCFSSRRTDVCEDARMEMSINFDIAGERITRQISVVHKDGNNQQKLLHIIMTFLGQKFITYLLLVIKDCEILDRRSTSRITDFIRNESRYEVADTDP